MFMWKIGWNSKTFFLLHCENYVVQRIIFLTGIWEINNDLPIDELTLLFGNEILNDEKNTQIFLQVQKFIQDIGRFTINWLLYDKVFWCLYCLPFVTDLERLFLLGFFPFFSFCLQQYATMDNSSLIPYLIHKVN
jgi:hypothetical protein